MFVKSWARLAGREVVGCLGRGLPKGARTLHLQETPALGRWTLSFGQKLPQREIWGQGRRGLPGILVCSFRVTCPEVI